MNASWKARSRAVTIPAFLLVIALIFIATWRLGMVLETKFSKVSEPEDRYYMPPSKWLKVFSLGYQEALSDLLWTKAVVYFGEQSQTRGEVKHHLQYLDAVMDLNPRFHGFYKWASLFSLFGNKKLTTESIRTAIRYLEIGQSLYPTDGDIAFSLGYIYSYELPGHLKGNEAKESKRKGALLMRRASLLEGGPSFAGRTAANLLTREGLEEEATQYMIDQLMSTTDDDTRIVFEAKLRERLGVKGLEPLIRARKRVFQEWKKEMPYAPLEVYLLIGPFPLIDPEEAMNPLVLTDRILAMDEPNEGTDAGMGADAGSPIYHL